LDLPDLPLVLSVVRAFEEGLPLVPERSPWLDRYCLERGISPSYLLTYISALDVYLNRCLSQIPKIEFIGFATWTPNYLATLLAAAHLKRRKNPPVIIGGGPQVTSSVASAEIGLRSGLFDCVVLGEGEQTLLEVYNSFRTNRSIGSTEGTATLNSDTGLAERRSRKQLQLDSLPIPSFEEMPLCAYQERRDLRALPFQLSRGCTDKCSFCSEWVFWQRYRSDSADHAVDQLGRLLRQYDANFIEFSDSLLNGHPRRLVGFAEQVVRSGLKFGWTSFMRAQMDADTAELLARSGCSGVFIGIESFSDEALALMNKRRTELQNIEAVRAFVEAGIHVTAGFIPGFPGDSRAGFLHSVEVISELQKAYPGRIELHEEPFTVMANAPIIKDLASAGLSPRFWANEYIDILPSYADVVEPVICSVEGKEQGLERIGRTTIVGAIKTDSPVKGRFEEGIDEDISIDRFGVTHFLGGWHLIRKKSRAGHRYCLILNDAETDDLLERQDEWFPIDETCSQLKDYLDRLEAKHLVPPRRNFQEVIRTFFTKNDDLENLFAVSPFIVGRELDWKHHNRVLFIDSITELCHVRPRRDALLVRSLIDSFLKGDDLWQMPTVRRSFRTRNRLMATLDQLAQLGIVVVCDRKQQVATEPIAYTVVHQLQQSGLTQISRRTMQ
jgi:hypothetical protein